jgi:hypothetical protein
MAVCLRYLAWATNWPLFGVQSTCLRGMSRVGVDVRVAFPTLPLDHPLRAVGQLIESRHLYGGPAWFGPWRFRVFVSSVAGIGSYSM